MNEDIKAKLEALRIKSVSDLEKLREKLDKAMETVSKRLGSIQESLDNNDVILNHTKVLLMNDGVNGVVAEDIDRLLKDEREKMLKQQEEFNTAFYDLRHKREVISSAIDKIRILKSLGEIATVLTRASDRLIKEEYGK
jgi:hypothetical protein